MSVAQDIVDIIEARYAELKDLCILHEANEDTHALLQCQERMYEIEVLLYRIDTTK